MRITLAVFVILLASLPAAAQPKAEDVEAAARAKAEEVRSWAQNPQILGAVREQDALKTPLSRIRAVDMSWVGEEKLNPRMQILLSNPCAKSLLSLTGAWPGYREAFVMDDQGALVCMTRKTTDYWQGDEPKWQKGWADGKGAVYVGPPEEDESTGTTLIHLSVPVMDGGKPIGVLTVGVDQNMLRKKITKP
jgi:hypothetical protein